MAEKQEISQTERMDLNNNVSLRFNAFRFTFLTSRRLRQVAAKIINPLEGLSRHHLLRNVDEFVAEKGLPDGEVFRRGALLAQDPENFENISDLTEEDKEAIRYERAHKWVCQESSTAKMRVILTYYVIRGSSSVALRNYIPGMLIVFVYIMFF